MSERTPPSQIVQMSTKKKTSRKKVSKYLGVRIFMVNTIFMVTIWFGLRQNVSFMCEYHEKNSANKSAFTHGSINYQRFALIRHQKSNDHAVSYLVLQKFGDASRVESGVRYVCHTKIHIRDNIYISYKVNRNGLTRVFMCFNIFLIHDSDCFWTGEKWF